MSVSIVIPARYASTRLPEKMLLCETGWPLIRHTYEQAKKSTLAKHVLIATDDERIYDCVKRFGADVVMTAKEHPTGTDRLAEVVTKYLNGVDCVVNVQGDEPECEPDNIDALIRLYQHTDAAMVTLVTRFKATATTGAGSPLDPNCVKAVLGQAVTHPQEGTVLGHQALYFSRSLVPYPRDTQGVVERPQDYFLHIGAYAYRPDFLKRYVTLKQGPLELSEKLEQLRLLENGYKIVANIVEHATPGIDTPADYESFVKRMKEHHGV